MCDKSGAGRQSRRRRRDLQLVFIYAVQVGEGSSAAGQAARLSFRGGFFWGDDCHGSEEAAYLKDDGLSGA